MRELPDGRILGCPGTLHSGSNAERVEADLKNIEYLCSEAFITFISEPHDDVADLILAPYSTSARGSEDVAHLDP